VDPAALIADESVKKMIQDRIAEALKVSYGGYEIPKKFVFLADDFTLENGMLTQTLKLKRAAVIDSFGEQIKAAYK
jgi:long-chain acyl-CoA synthetase